MSIFGRKGKEKGVHNHSVALWRSIPVVPASSESLSTAAGDTTTPAGRVAAEHQAKLDAAPILVRAGRKALRVS